MDKENNQNGTTTVKNESATTGSGVKVTFDAIVETDDNFQLFYNEDGSESFTGEEMIELPVKSSNEAQKMEFILPDDVTPLNFRFDIGSNKDLKQVKFINFKMEYKGKSFVSEENKFFKYFYPNDQVVLDTINSVAKTMPKEGQGYDPIIGGTLELRNELQKLVQ